jgi:NADH-ubiquinone oxidoreductase chain 6
MSNIFILIENYTNGYRAELLDFISLLSILCGIFVIISKNPIISVLFLIGLFLSISIYLMMLGINFIGLSYLLVYVGAVSILFLFILMLINIRISELLDDTNNSLPLGILLSIAFYNFVNKLLPYSNEDIVNNLLERIINYSKDSNQIFYVTSNL